MNMLQKMLQEKDSKIKELQEENEYLNNVIQSQDDRFSAETQLLKSELVFSCFIVLICVHIILIMSVEIEWKHKTTCKLQKRIRPTPCGACKTRKGVERCTKQALC